MIEDDYLKAELIEAVHDNDGYCPCKVEKNEDTRCICKEFRESNSVGPCHCGLWVKLDD